MRTLNSAVLRAILLGSLGLSVDACSGQTSNDGAPDGPMGVAGTGGWVGAAGTGGLPTGVSACTDPVPQMAGVDTGIYKCSEGYLHRAAARECSSRLPRDVVVEFPDGANAGVDPSMVVDECSRDTDCPENARCTLVNNSEQLCFGPPPPPEPVYSRQCLAGCRTDADCGGAAVCVCGEEIGYCSPISSVAGCRTDADCGGGQCLSNAKTSNFDYTGSFACTLPGDQCASDADCGGTPFFCAMGSQGRTCQPGAVCGRPFMVEHTARLAKAIPTDDWLPSQRQITCALEGQLRARLRDHWTQIGLMEHASVAAFARFTLDLISLGAPAELITASTRAQSDEIRHARMAFDLAAAYGGTPVGPGPIDLSGALSGRSIEEILRTTIVEGCVGETRAALEATEAALHVTDARVKETLEIVAADEADHAALAWRVVRWILEKHPELCSVAHDEFVRVLQDVNTEEVSADAHNEALAAHGCLAGEVLAIVHRAAAHEVILPCAAALLESVRANHHGSHAAQAA